jgi:hypothetical protein
VGKKTAKTKSLTENAAKRQKRVLFLCVLLDVGNSGIPCLFSLDVPLRLRALREMHAFFFVPSDG